MRLFKIVYAELCKAVGVGIFENQAFSGAASVYNGGRLVGIQKDRICCCGRPFCLFVSFYTVCRGASGGSAGAAITAAADGI